MTDGQWEKFGGAWMYVPRRVESVKEMMQRCREADAERAAAGEQDGYLWQTAHGVHDSRRRWQDKYFGGLER